MDGHCNYVYCNFATKLCNYFADPTDDLILNTVQYAID